MTEFRRQLRRRFAFNRLEDGLVTTSVAMVVFGHRARGKRTDPLFVPV